MDHVWGGCDKLKLVMIAVRMFICLSHFLCQYPVSLPVSLSFPSPLPPPTAECFSFLSVHHLFKRLRGFSVVQKSQVAWIR